MMTKRPLEDDEVRKGQRLEPLEFGDRVTKRLVGNPNSSASGNLLYGYQDGMIVWTEIALIPGLR